MRYERCPRRESGILPVCGGRSGTDRPSLLSRCGPPPRPTLAKDAERQGQHLVLDVLTVNRRAQALYRRLGLTEVTRPGDRGIRITMRSARYRE